MSQAPMCNEVTGFSCVFEAAQLTGELPPVRFMTWAGEGKRDHRSVLTTQCQVNNTIK